MKKLLLSAAVLAILAGAPAFAEESSSSGLDTVKANHADRVEKRSDRREEIKNKVAAAKEKHQERVDKRKERRDERQAKLKEAKDKHEANKAERASKRETRKPESSNS